MNNGTKQRNRKSGQYTYEGQWDRVCKVCGSTLGKHMAEAPHDNDDLTLGPLCSGFKPVRK